MASGRIIQFNQVRGFGFIEPDDGGEDVFLHCAELGENANLARPGLRVEYNVLKGDRGLKASDVVIVAPALTTAHIPQSSTAMAPVRQEASGAASEEGALLDVLSTLEYEREVTEVLLDVLPSITAAEIVEVRRTLAKSAAQRGWLED